MTKETELFGPISLAELTFYTSRAAFGAGCPQGVADDVAAIAVAMVKANRDPAKLISASLDQIVDRSVETTNFDISSAQDEAGKISLNLSSKTDKPCSAIFAGLALSDYLNCHPFDAEIRAKIQQTDSVDLVAETIKAYATPKCNYEFETTEDQSITIKRCTRTEKITNSNSDTYLNMMNKSGWDGIQTHFKSSLVKATEASRLSGAGAGLVDTD